MRFGLSGIHGGLEGPGPSSTLQLARLAEDLGFDCLWINEEHFDRHETPDARPVLSPVPLAAAIAGATTRIRVGFSVLLVPLHHPLRLAEELATLDVVSTGRVNLGVSAANSARYNQAFGYRPEDGPSLEECLDTILGYWNGVPITADGVDYCVSPRPHQRPHPPIFIGAYQHERLQWAARNGFAIIQHGIQSPTSLRRCLQTYTDAGGDASRVPVGRFCYVGESDTQAQADAADIAARQARRLHQIGLWRKGDLITTETDLDPERFYHETAIIGGPQTVADRIKALSDDHGVRYINLLSSFFGLMPEHLLRSSLHLFATQVIPLITHPAAPATPANVSPGRVTVFSQ